MEATRRRRTASIANHLFLHSKGRPDSRPFYLHKLAAARQRDRLNTCKGSPTPSAGIASGVGRPTRTVLIEKGRIGAEQSGCNWGWCRQQSRDARELPISTTSLDLWERFAAETGEKTGFRRCGLLYLSNNEAEIAGWARWRDFAKTVGVTTHMLSASEVAEKGRARGRNWKGGVFSPTDGIADPASAVPAVARAIVKLGDAVIQNCAARGGSPYYVVAGLGLMLSGVLIGGKDNSALGLTR